VHDFFCFYREQAGEFNDCRIVVVHLFEAFFIVHLQHLVAGVVDLPRTDVRCGTLELMGLELEVVG
jgi:hypothetical protein